MDLVAIITNRQAWILDDINLLLRVPNSFYIAWLREIRNSV